MEINLMLIQGMLDAHISTHVYNGVLGSYILIR